MRKLTVKIVASIAGFVYQLGCDLYALSDRLDGWDGEAEPVRVSITVGEPTMTTSNNATVTYNRTGTPPAS